MAYMGQSHLIEVNPRSSTADEPLSALYRAFEAAHERINGHSTGAPAKIVNLRAIHRVDLPGIDFGGRTGNASRPVLEGRIARCYFPGSARGYARPKIHDRALIAGDEVIAGPAVIEQGGHDDAPALGLDGTSFARGGAASANERSIL